jgi:transcriptional regulator with XRE-family HTH domain
MCKEQNGIEKRRNTPMFPSKEHVFDTREERELLGQRLELARLKKGLAQLDALEQSTLIQKTERPGYYTGVTKGFLTYVEKGHRGVTQDQLKLLATTYGVAEKWLKLPTPLTRGELSELIELRAKIVRGRKPLKLSPSVQVPSVKLQEHLTPGDKAILTSVSECSEPEKIWLTGAIAQLLKKVRQHAET